MSINENLLSILYFFLHSFDPSVDHLDLIANLGPEVYEEALGNIQDTYPPMINLLPTFNQAFAAVCSACVQS